MPPGQPAQVTHADAPSRCFLFELPQELQDLIFSYAYPETQPLKIVFKPTWDQNEEKNRMSHGSDCVTKPFPRLRIEEWLVSKRYFLAAADAWMSIQDFGAGGGQSWGDSISHTFISAELGLFQTFCIHATVSFDLSYKSLTEHPIKALKMCCRLRDLKIFVDHQSFSGIAGQYAFETLFDDGELRRLVDRSGLGTLQGLRAFSIEAQVDRYVNTALRKQFSPRTCHVCSRSHGSR